MSQPTEVQLEKFWRRFGVKGRWVEDGRKLKFPRLDPNNLVKHVIPKLHAWTMGSCPDGDVVAVAVLEPGVRGENATTQDPTLAMFWAICNAAGL